MRFPLPCCFVLYRVEPCSLCCCALWQMRVLRCGVVPSVIDALTEAGRQQYAEAEHTLRCAEQVLLRKKETGAPPGSARPGPARLGSA